MSNNTTSGDLYQTFKMVNDAVKDGIKADRLQDDRLGKQLRMLTSTSELSHKHALQSLHMLLLRYGKPNRVPEALFDEITKDGNRLDRFSIEIKVAKEFPEFEIVKDPVTMQMKYQKIKQQWNENVFKAIRAADVSTDSSNAMFSTIQMLTAHKDYEQSKSGNDFLDEVM